MPEPQEQITYLDQDPRTRLRFLGFTHADAELLQSLRPWAGQILPKFVKEFFDRAFRDPQFVATGSHGGGSREQLEASQRAYIPGLFLRHARRGLCDEPASVPCRCNGAISWTPAGRRPGTMREAARQSWGIPCMAAKPFPGRVMPASQTLQFDMSEVDMYYLDSYPARAGATGPRP